MTSDIVRKHMLRFPLNENAFKTTVGRAMNSVASTVSNDRIPVTGVFPCRGRVVADRASRRVREPPVHDSHGSSAARGKYVGVLERIRSRILNRTRILVPQRPRS